MDVLISGASIAGLASAHWLARAGHTVTVVERADGLRSGGVSIDVREEAVEVARRMGVLDEIQERRVPHEDVYRFVDESGTTQAELRPAADVYESSDDVEISRDVLGEILRAAVPDSVTFRFDTWIAAIADGPDGGPVVVTLSDGSTSRFDLVVGADGMHSNVRELVFGAEKQFVHHLGLYVSIAKRCRTVRVETGSEVLNTPGRMVMLRSDGTSTSALLGFRSEWLDHDFRDASAQREIVRRAFEGMDGWVAPQAVSEVLDADDFYFDSVSQIRMSSWSRGRCVLVGDAAYCASFFSGMGTTLAMVGAHALALALDTAGGDLPAALAGYDDRMRPLVDRAQAIAGQGAALLFPPTRAAIEERNAGLRAAARV
ncbi:FAD-dependent monooxygenase [Nocardioides alkalitolerans]|uniref:FAD-dependent monooxygenase n=1 Tax=Nocardioides alkalitolerans TaxID=281714 RepID=UPI0004179CD9|nr:FAD-dependent monooxygenase [Nocardioides alkalitolerans]